MIILLTKLIVRYDYSCQQNMWKIVCIAVFIFSVFNFAFQQANFLIVNTLERQLKLRSV